MIRKKISEIIEVPEGIVVEITEDVVKMKKDSEEVEKKIHFPVEKKDNQLIVADDNPTKRDKMQIKTAAAHLRNMVNGLEEKYVYKLQIASVHFPINVSVQGDEVIIKNFLGEVKDRKAKIVKSSEVKIEGEIVIVESSDKEKAGQTAANIEIAAKLKGRDRRIFQDGIFITEKQKGVKK